METYEKLVDEKGTVFLKTTKTVDTFIDRDALLKKKLLLEEELIRVNNVLDIIK